MRTKLSDELWVRFLSDRAGVSEDAARRVWEAVKAGIAEGTGPDGCGKCSIPGFGTFVRIMHKGHPLNLGAGPFLRVDDYPVLKFRPSEAFKEQALRAGKPVCR